MERVVKNRFMLQSGLWSHLGIWLSPSLTHCSLRHKCIFFSWFCSFDPRICKKKTPQWLKFKSPYTNKENDFRRQNTSVHL